MNGSEQELHDLLVACKPPDIVHNCKLCDSAKEPEGPVDLTKEQEAEVARRVDAAVAEATASLRAELDDLKAGQATAEQTAAIEAALEPVKAELDTLRSQLDEAVARATAAEQKLADTEAYLQAEEEAKVAAAEAEARKDERVEQVKALEVFPEEHLEANADRWAAMDDEAFTAQLAEYELLADKVHDGKRPTTTVPAKRSALTAREEPAKRTPARTSAAREVMQLRGKGVDVRQLV